MNQAIRIAALVAAAAMASVATAQGFPERPIRIVVPFAAGGPLDIITRPLAQRMAEGMRAQVVVDNRGGANGIIGIENVAKSPPDGHSLVTSSGGTHAIGPHVYAKLPYDIVRDFAPVSLYVTVPGVLVTHPALPVATVKELVALARARPGQLSFGSSGTGGTPHLAGELLMSAAGIRMVHVPYKGMGPATMDLMGGQIQLAFADLPVMLPQITSAKLRAIAVGTRSRSTNLPAVPTMTEAGFPQIEVYNWYALFAPAGTPPAVIARLNAEVVRVVALPEMKSFAQSQGTEAVSSTPDELAALHRRELDKWGAVVKAAGVRMD